MKSLVLITKAAVAKTASDDGAISAGGVCVGTAKGTENEDGEMVYDNYGSLESASSGIKQKAEEKTLLTSLT